MTEQNKAKTILLIEKLRLIESEIYRIVSKYGVKNIDELDRLIQKGTLSEEKVGDDVFIFDNLLSEKEELEKELEKLSVKRTLVWENLQNLLELQKLSFQT